MRSGNEERGKGKGETKRGEGEMEGKKKEKWTNSFGHGHFGYLLDGCMIRYRGDMYNTERVVK